MPKKKKKRDWTIVAWHVLQSELRTEWSSKYIKAVGKKPFSALSLDFGDSVKPIALSLSLSLSLSLCSSFLRKFSLSLSRSYYSLRKFLELKIRSHKWRPTNSMIASGVSDQKFSLALLLRCGKDSLRKSQKSQNACFLPFCLFFFPCLVAEKIRVSNIDHFTCILVLLLAV